MNILFIENIGDFGMDGSFDDVVYGSWIVFVIELFDVYLDQLDSNLPSELNVDDVYLVDELSICIYTNPHERCYNKKIFDETIQGVRYSYPDPFL